MPARLSDSFAHSTWPERLLSEQCHRCGMIFMIPSQDGHDEKDARRRLHLAATRHSGCTRQEPSSHRSHGA